ncbi:MAG: N4-gp56 family major capsid protein [Deltaproteobacteria bacterium]|nr:MAG: N4-gp56 family major capsid protein [Deltaproteobacteria bacterium]
MGTQTRQYDGVGDYGGAATGPGNRTNVYAELDLLERARPQLVLDLACDKKFIPANKAETIAFRRAVNVDAHTDQVTEGVNPASRGLAYEDVFGTLGEFAEIFEITSRMRELGEDNAIRDSSDVLADLVANIKEAVGWAAFTQGTNVIFGGGVADRDFVATPVSLGEFQEAVRSLMAAKATRFTTVDHGGLNEGTYPIEAAFYAFTHTDLHPDIRMLPGFKTTAEYGAKKIVSEYEFGAIENARILTTPQLTPYENAGAAVGTTNLKSTGGTTVDVYPILVCGKHALGTVDLKGAGKKGYGGVKINVLSGASKSDPTDQRSYVACRWWDLKLILNDEWVVRIEVGATDDLSQLYV